MKKRIISSGILLLFFATSIFADNNSQIMSMQRMVMRLFPNYSHSFIFKQTPTDNNNDCFTLKSVNNKIIISGNSANSMAVGLNYYLKNYCMTTVSWFKTDPIEMPKVLPQIKETIKVNAKIKTRFFLNYCTFGYTMPWWNWKDWERFIDWMALNGINTPLAITGQEAIWYSVWKKFGLTDTEIRSFFTGPAHLPWQRMCNVDSWQGPLPMSWINSQKELQKLIVNRERELNMKPVLPAFSGHVPDILKRLYPNIHTTRVSKWSGFADQYRCTFLSPVDSIYSAIQKSYLEEQTKLYGTDHIYGVDPFNEVDPPSWREDSLAMISSHIYQSMKAVDKDAVWLQMTWFLYNNPQHWTAPRVKTLLRSVPQDKLLLLDYFCDNTEFWKRTESYYGQPFIWCFLGNFGGKTDLYAPLKTISERIANTYKQAGNNFIGIGSTLEGFGINPFSFEFALDKAWDMPQTDAQWLNNLADRRLGKKNNIARTTWENMNDKVFQKPTLIFIETRPRIRKEDTDKYPNQEQEALISAWKQFVSIPNAKRDTYKFDIVNIGHQVLQYYFYHLYNNLLAAYNAGDVAKLKATGDKMKEVLKDADALVACHSTFSLKHWIDSARSIGINAAEKNYYEKNARTIITVWGDSPNLTDYARRMWAGLISSYYAPRWIKFIDTLTNCTENHKAFDGNAFKLECITFENHFIEPDFPINYPQSGNAVLVSKMILKKYFE